MSERKTSTSDPAAWLPPGSFADPPVERRLNKIPFNRPFIVGKELFYISQAVLGGHLSGNGRYTQLCCRWMEEQFGAAKVLLTNSCTAALEMAAILAGVGPGDEVIMPSYTFVSTANAFALRGASIKFVDIREDTLNLDESLVEDAITDRTKAIVPVHYAGVACEMDTLLDIADRNGVVVIEDAAQGVASTYKGRSLGTLGQLGCYSFHETKNFISGEGGALVVNDESLIERAEIVRDKGTNRAQFYRGAVDKYTWVEIGSSYLPSEMVAAFLYAQLEESGEITRRRTEIFTRYADAFAPLAARGDLRIPSWPDECVPNAHMFYVVLPDAAMRDSFIAHLAAQKIQTVIHYVPLHTSPMGRGMGNRPGTLPVTESVAERLVRLPCYFELSEFEQSRVVDAVTSFFED